MRDRRAEAAKRRYQSLGKKSEKSLECTYRSPCGIYMVQIQRANETTKGKTKFSLNTGERDIARDRLRVLVADWLACGLLKPNSKAVLIYGPGGSDAEFASESSRLAALQWLEGKRGAEPLRANRPQIKETELDAEICRLAALSEWEFERQLPDAAKQLGLTVAVLDRLVKGDRVLKSAAPEVPPVKAPSKEAAIGWHGITPKIILDRADHRQIDELGGTAIKIVVEPKSPARTAKLKSGDFLVSISPSPIEDMSFVEFEAVGLLAGHEVFAKYWRPQRGPVRIDRTVLRLRERPGPRKERPWEKTPRRGFGPEVARDERKKFMAAMAHHPRMTDIGNRILTRLLFYHDGPMGIVPSYRTIANGVRRVKRRCVIDQIEQLSWLGVVEVVKNGGIRTASGWTNKFTVHWPEGWGLGEADCEGRKPTKR
jgi:hypothetical protein